MFTDDIFEDRMQIVVDLRPYVEIISNRLNKNTNTFYPIRFKIVKSTLEM